MNFPVGEVISKANMPISFVTIVSELKKINFNGYVVMSISENCFEEGAVFFREGDFCAAIVECSFLEKVVKGDEALKMIFNLSLGKGFFQTIQLSRSQVDLVTAFDEKLLISNKINLKDLPKLIPSTFESNFVLEDNNENVLDKYGLNFFKKKV